MAKPISFSTGPWITGLNSLIPPAHLADTQFQWSQNTITRGGKVGTRPGNKSIQWQGDSYENRGRGFTSFIPATGDPYLVAAIGRFVWTSKYPYVSNRWVQLPGIVLGGQDTSVFFESAMKGAQTNADGSLTVLETPYPVLMISDNLSNTYSWDGHTVKKLLPDQNQTPVCGPMKWVGNRLWVLDGNKLRASNILDPETFTEEDLVVEGGFFTLPGIGTGLGATPSFTELLAFTDFSTTAFQVALPRSAWGSTPGFQKIILPGIGCVAPKTVVLQFGMLWWLAHGGLMALNNALITYHSSKIVFQDQNMMRGKQNLASDVSRACAGTFENFLMLSVPSGDLFNSQTWVMDQGIIDTLNEQAAPVWSSTWKGLRPVDWTTVAVRGQPRCFTLSNDYQGEGEGFNSHYIVNGWETFLKRRIDRTHDATGRVSNKSISCSFETKLLGDSDEYKVFQYAELDITDLSDLVKVEIWYAGKYSGYKQIGYKEIVATRTSLSEPTVTLQAFIDSYVSQGRSVRSVNETLQQGDSNIGVQSPRTRNEDQAFSILVKWTGQMSLQAIRIYVTPAGNQFDGRCEEIETTGRHTTANGTEAIQETRYLFPTVYYGLTSGLVHAAPSKVTEEHYQCLI